MDKEFVRLPPLVMNVYPKDDDGSEHPEYLELKHVETYPPMEGEEDDPYGSYHQFGATNKRGEWVEVRLFLNGADYNK